MAAKNLDFVIRAQDRFTKDMERFNARLARMDKNVKKSQKTMSTFTGFKSIAGLIGVGAAGGIGAVAIKTGIAFNVLEENALLAFETMINGAKTGTSAISDIGQQFSAAERAAQLFRGVQQAALKQPFKLTELIPATQKLLAFGFAAEQIPTMMNEIADAAAGLGGSPEMLNRIAMAFGQIKTKGKVSGEEMMQLAEAGIPAWQMLAENIGMVGPQFAKMQEAINNGSLPIEKAVQMTMKLGEQGKLTGAGAIAALRKGMIARFGGLGEKQSKTTAGAFSNLSDELEVFAKELQKPVFKDAADTLRTMTESVKKLREEFEKMPPEQQKTISYTAGIALALGSTGALAASIAFMTGGVGGLGKLAAGFATITGPLGWAVLGIGVMAALALAWNADFLGMKTNVDNFLKPLGKVGDFISKMVGTNSVAIALALHYAFAKKIWDWLFEGKDPPGPKAIAVTIEWAKGPAEKIGNFLLDTNPLARPVIAVLSWQAGLAQRVWAWLEGTGITAQIEADFKWAAKWAKKIWGWLTDDEAITANIVGAFEWLKGLSTAVWKWISGENTVEANVWGNFELRGVYWEWVKGWVARTIELGERVWAQFVLWGVDWDWVKKWVARTIELGGHVWGNFELRGVDWDWVKGWEDNPIWRAVNVKFNLLGGAWDYLYDWAIKPIEREINIGFTFMGAAQQVWNWINGTGGKSVQTAHGAGNFIPQLAAGGIVNSPTLAMIGEAGPEAVIPLSRRRGAMGGDTHHHYYNFTNDGVVTTNDVQSWFRRMQDEGRARGVAA